MPRLQYQSPVVSWSTCGYVGLKSAGTTCYEICPLTALRDAENQRD